ncbi:MAG: methionyl-tRNA formyltransferase [Bacteroidales bacterium]|nr:methionyl-tRNA formyltransferase [Bacteroidales bacterium]
MNKKNLRIVYMGTPDFAVEPLKVLVEGGYQVVCVVTMPDKLAGRGMKLQLSPVKKYALSQDLPLLQPEKLKDPTFLKELKSFHAELQIVVAFRMLPEEVWTMPSMGTFNLHASLLPQYRGAAPINWAVINGEKETGVTTFFLQHEIDTGDMLFQEKIGIGPDECMGSVHDRLMELGGRMVLKTVDAMIDGSAHARSQDVMISDRTALKSAPKLFKENTRIDWTHECVQIHDFIRGLSPFPVAWSELHSAEGEMLGVKIFEAGYALKTHGLEPGTLVTDGKKELKVAVNDGYIILKRFQLAGRKALATDEFLRGFPRISDYTFV